jgi:acyl-CoA hydrolase
MDEGLMSGEFDVTQWRSFYKAKEIQPDMLKDLIRPGSRIFIGTGCSEPVILTRILVDSKLHFHDCQIIHFLTLSDQKFFDEIDPSRFRHNTLSIIGNDRIRTAIQEGTADFTPIKSSEIPEMLKNHIIPVDVALIQVSPPDQYGYCSLGINVDINRTVVDVAKLVIAQINPRMPASLGDSHIRFDDITKFVYHESPLLSFNYSYSAHDQEILSKIGPALARLIENGSTLNIGLGKIPNAIWSFLKEKQNLAIYSEVLTLTPDLIHLIQNNVINCKENVFPHIVTSFALGTEETYRFLDRNPFIQFQPIEYLNKITNIAQNTKMTSIYGALSVDLTGQVTNHRENHLYSGVGGEYDFIVGSSQAKRGKTIIVLPSTSKDGTQSRIVSVLPQIMIPATDVHFVVTEWGVARLAGKTLRERTLQMIGIAHPHFRMKLLEEAKLLHYVYSDQILPVTVDGVVVQYPENLESEIICKSGAVVYFHPVQPTDEQALQRFYYQLDEKSRINRFLTPKRVFSHEEFQLRVNIDYDYTMVMIGLDKREEGGEIVCVGSYVRDLTGSTNFAEVAITIGTNWRSQGLGRHLFLLLGEIAQGKGIEGFYGDVMAENKAILQLIQSLPFKVVFQNYGETMAFSYRFSEIAEKVGNLLPSTDPFMIYKNPI